MFNNNNNNYNQNQQLTKNQNQNACEQKNFNNTIIFQNNMNDKHHNTSDEYVVSFESNSYFFNLINIDKPLEAPNILNKLIKSIKLDNEYKSKQLLKIFLFKIILCDNNHYYKLKNHAVNTIIELDDVDIIKSTIGAFFDIDKYGVVDCDTLNKIFNSTKKLSNKKKFCNLICQQTIELQNKPKLNNCSSHGKKKHIQKQQIKFKTNKIKNCILKLLLIIKMK